MRRMPDPSMFMMYCWSQAESTFSCRWKINCLPEREKYASALFPSKVSCRMFRRWRSPGAGARTVGDGAAPVEL
jgi:hypothetical protein